MTIAMGKRDQNAIAKRLQLRRQRTAHAAGIQSPSAAPSPIALPSPQWRPPQASTPVGALRGAGWSPIA